jgi:hypothetical protein
MRIELKDFSGENKVEFYIPTSDLTADNISIIINGNIVNPIHLCKNEVLSTCKAILESYKENKNGNKQIDKKTSKIKKETRKYKCHTPG